MLRCKGGYTMQQPPDLFPQYPQQQWQQPPMPTQQPPFPPQQYQQPPQYQPPMPPPKKKSRKGLFIVLGVILAVVLFGCIGVSAMVNAGGQAAQQTLNQTSTHVAQIPTTQPTTQPTIAPTAKPTTPPTVKTTMSLAATHGTPLLGGPISDFIGAYGQPDPHSSIQQGYYDLHFLPSTSPLSNVDGIIVSTDPGSTTYLSANILVQAQNDVGFSLNDAKTRCLTFAPSDTRFVKEFVYADNTGFDMVYTSVGLAKDFPASSFTDSQQNQVQAGTFDVQYLYSGDNQHIDSCDIVIGEQQTTN